MWCKEANVGSTNAVEPEGGLAILDPELTIARIWMMSYREEDFVGGR
jgi:hypothetical protein